MIDYKLKKYRLSKSIKIRISTNGEVVISAPPRASKKECEAFLKMHEEWVRNTLLKLKTRNEESTHSKLKADGKIAYLGEALDLTIDSSIKPKYIISNDEIILKNSDLSSFYKTEARKIFESKCAEIAPFYGVNYAKIRIGSQKSRWGSCSSNKTLSFNQNLVKAPRSIIEYVVIHEICHLLQPNHSAAFWNEVGRLCGDFREKRAWLKRSSHELTE